MKLYETLFFWMVDEMNTFNNNKQTETNDNPLICIGILDIFGFENLSRNGLEQLCINYANEIVQGLLNKKLIEDKIKLYNEEHIPISSTALQLNSGQIDLIERIFMALDEECMLPRGSNRGFIDKLTFHYSSNPFYQITKLSQHQSFSIEHYAGKIEYAVESFVQCNIDKQQISIDTWIEGIFSPIKKKDADKKKRRNSVNTLKIHSISNQFRNNLANFLTITKDNQLHFIKCIKPNTDQTAMAFTDDIVRNQLVYNGVIQLITILKQGFECYFLWIPFQRDYGRYMLETDPKEAFVIGHTRIFLTQDYYNILKSRHFEKIKESSIVLQTRVRRSVAMRDHVKMKMGVQCLENRMWCNLIQRDYHLNRSSRRLQDFFRTIMEQQKRRKRIAANTLARFIQARCRTKAIILLSTEKQHKRKAASARIQKWWRFILRRKYDLQKRNNYLEAQIVQKDCRIWSLERRILELEQRLGRSLVLDKNIIHERDHVIVSLRKDIERYQQNIDERLKEKLNLLEKMDQIKNENRILIYQLANARNRSSSGWFSRFF
jgi:myosin-5